MTLRLTNYQVVITMRFMIAPSISVHADVLVILYLLVHRSVLLLRTNHAPLHCIKISYAAHEIGLLLCPCLCMLYESGRWWRKLRDRSTFDSSIIDEESPMEIMTVNELIGEAAEEVLALGPMKSGWVLHVGSSETVVDLLLG